jgi:hypothetical protein
LLEQKVGTSF